MTRELKFDRSREREAVLPLYGPGDMQQKIEGVPALGRECDEPLANHFCFRVNIGPARFCRPLSAFPHFHVSALRGDLIGWSCNCTTSRTLAGGRFSATWSQENCVSTLSFVMICWLATENFAHLVFVSSPVLVPHGICKSNAVQVRCARSPVETAHHRNH